MSLVFIGLLDATLLTQCWPTDGTLSLRTFVIVVTGSRF